jgi:hypothetical protein
MRVTPSRGLVTALMSGLLAVILGVTLATAASAATRQIHDPVPIEPNQTFSGFINNSPPGAVIIKVDCAVGATTGHPMGHQPVEVKPAPVASTQDVGFTGSKGKKITASLAPASTANLVLGSFTSYYVKKFIPVKITVPCSGTGTAIFTPSPHSKTAKAAMLAVTFGNITG